MARQCPETRAGKVQTDQVVPLNQVRSKDDVLPGRHHVSSRLCDLAVNYKRAERCGLYPRVHRPETVYELAQEG
ncbi:hypothetical protein D3C77_667390 [compost metagenome]